MPEHEPQSQRRGSRWRWFGSRLWLLVSVFSVLMGAAGWEDNAIVWVQRVRWVYDFGLPDIPPMHLYSYMAGMLTGAGSLGIILFVLDRWGENMVARSVHGWRILRTFPLWFRVLRPLVGKVEVRFGVVSSIPDDLTPANPTVDRRELQWTKRTRKGTVEYLDFHLPPFADLPPRVVSGREFSREPHHQCLIEVPYIYRVAFPNAQPSEWKEVNLEKLEEKEGIPQFRRYAGLPIVRRAGDDDLRVFSIKVVHYLYNTAGWAGLWSLYKGGLFERPRPYFDPDKPFRLG